MKVIAVDNFNRETVDDILVCENVNEYHGNMIVEMLNKRLSSRHSLTYYRLVEDNYTLHKFEI
ncbi:hypothetical protein P4393_12540 [Bacillus subtilis]|nr:hypothetical protein [Bacillus subtilis]MED3474656.1 hypothetical protein [Bacillus subtilis]